MAIYDTMQFVENDVATVAMGLAARWGSSCSAPARRASATPRRTRAIMMHQPSGGLGGTASDIAIQAEQMLYTKKMLQERIAFHTGQTVEQIEKDSDRDRWFTADEAKEYGFVDHVVTRASQVPSAGAAPDRRRRAGDHDETSTQTSDAATPSGRYILPTFIERTSYGFKRVQPLHEAVRGAHHLPRRADRRRRRPTT